MSDLIEKTSTSKVAPPNGGVRMDQDSEVALWEVFIRSRQGLDQPRKTYLITHNPQPLTRNPQPITRNS